MKKIFFGITVITYSLISAQQSGSSIKFGAKAGANLSTILLDGDKVGDSRMGIYIGGFVNIPVGRVLSIQPEIFYIQTGSKNLDSYTFTRNGGRVKVNNLKFNLDYISVPIMFQFNITRGFYLEVGPQLNFLINNKIDGDVKMNGLTQGISANNKLKTSGFEFGYALGTGYYITPNIGINVRYSFSATLDHNATDNIYETYKATSLFQVGLAYKF
ncbi:PorT family protein [Chryseobacterium nematophagum]|uniref:PorT family protein n=1 Tax=Chryseobacterium nematophagum TaxID=2305228 RepID=A0A3M7LE27_9FLAO|nr:porin family protein [Chryseobacterium nematophagum]RMZ60981.1 PorT family protein [Chryseobacterium nematophagum]